jgi:hypothetical protein
MAWVQVYGLWAQGQQIAALRVSADNRQAIQVLVNGEMYPSNGNGEVQIGQLSAGTHQLTVRIMNAGGRASATLNRDAFLEAGYETIYTVRLDPNRQWVLRQVGQEPLNRRPGGGSTYYPGTGVPPPTVALNGCTVPMPDPVFGSALGSIQSKTQENIRFTVAQEIVRKNCLTAQMIRAIVEQFRFEQTRVDFAIFAYPYTFDPNNYFVVYDALNENSVPFVQQAIAGLAPGQEYLPPPQQPSWQAPPRPVAPPTPPAFMFPGRAGNRPPYMGPVLCQNPIMPDDVYNAAKTSIVSKNFESTKLAVARQIFSNYCLLAADVRDIMGLFAFESSRLEFAKFAYPLTYDAQNYFIVNDGFTFESSIDNLQQFIQQR